MSETESAWMAGVFDGEGSVIRPRKSSPRSIRLQVGGTCEPFIRQIATVTGTGAVYFRPSQNPKHNDQWIWQCHAENARSLLRQMLPWLIVKRERALEFLNGG